MHEFSLMTALTDTVLEASRKSNVVKVLRIDLDVGEGTMAQEDALMFAFETLKAEEKLLAEAKLVITMVPLELKCASCGFEGPPERMEETFHMFTPMLKCPKCQGEITIMKGRDCVIRNIEAEVPD
jgi:hydrogenase nickel incorporation protein HypA/HybF